MHVNKPANCIELVANIRGQVQGVGFRMAAKSLAQRLHLKGFARNLTDGSVEICAQGTKDQLEGFLSQLKAEFPGIIHMATDFHSPLTMYADFKILR
jgi:acylphosphatase